MAMQRARPIMISPAMYSGYPCRNTMARTNIRIGPTTQFCTSERPSTRLLRKTSCSSSYRTLVKGGYIIRINPAAIGTDVVPMLKRFRNGTTPGTSQPNTTPVTMAAKIHAVR